MNIRYLKKLWNYRLVEYQKKRGSSVVFGYPYWLTIDPCSYCNLRCRFCPTGQDRGVRPHSMLPLKKFESIMRTLGPYLIHIDFCNWGEPLLNKEVAAMVACAKKYGVTTKIDSNINVPLNEETARALISSGLDQLNMSVDGASQETYEIYRAGGDFSLALNNMKLLARVRKELGMTTPRLHWQFLVFRHNEHELDKAALMAKEIGIDSVGFTAPFCAPEWVSTKDEFNNYLPKAAGDGGVEFKKSAALCTWLWDGIAINADGSISPCCSVEEKKDDFGKFYPWIFPLVWNNRKYRAARRHMRSPQPAGADNVCIRCDHIGASNHAAIDERRIVEPR